MMSDEDSAAFGALPRGRRARRAHVADVLAPEMIAERMLSLLRDVR